MHYLSRVRIAQSLVFLVVFCEPLFVALCFFFFWSFDYLFFVDNPASDNPIRIFKNLKMILVDKGIYKQLEEILKNFPISNPNK
jgi:hypothetical protein